MALPFYRGLRAHYPNAHLTLLSKENLAGFYFPEIFDAQWILKKSESKFPLGLFRAAIALRASKFDLGINLPASLSSAFLLWAAKIPARVGYAETVARLFLTVPLPWLGVEAKRHKAQLYLDLLDFLTATTTLLTLPPALRENSEKLIVVAPGAAIALREWPYFATLIQDLKLAYRDHRVVVVGSRLEAKWHELLAPLKAIGVEDAVESTSLRELKALCERAAVVVANDSGVAHLAATLAGAPTVVLFGPGNPDYVKPLGHGVPVLVGRVGGVPCSPCESAVCRAPYGYQKCLKALSPENVIALVAQLLR